MSLKWPFLALVLLSFTPFAHAHTYDAHATPTCSIEIDIPPLGPYSVHEIGIHYRIFMGDKEINRTDSLSSALRKVKSLTEMEICRKPLCSIELSFNRMDPRDSVWVLLSEKHTLGYADTKKEADREIRKMKKAGACL